MRRRNQPQEYWDLMRQADDLYGQAYRIRQRHFQPMGMGYGRHLPLGEPATARVKDLTRARGKLLSRARTVKKKWVAAGSPATNARRRRAMKRNARQTRFKAELKKLLRRGVPAAQAMKRAWKRVPKNPRTRLTRGKARAILHHRRVRGHVLTPAQRGLFGAKASGYRLTEYPGLNAPPAIRLFGNGKPIGVIAFRPTSGRRRARNPRIDIRI